MVCPNISVRRLSNASAVTRVKLERLFPLLLANCVITVPGRATVPSRCSNASTRKVYSLTEHIRIVRL